MKCIILKDQERLIVLEDVREVKITRDAYDWLVFINYVSGGCISINCGHADKGKAYADKCFEKICKILVDKI